MLRRWQHVDQVGNLGIDAIERRIGNDGGIHLRIFGLQGAHNLDRGISFIMHAKNDLQRTVIILGEKRLQVARQIRLALMQRLEDGDSRTVARLVLRRLHEAADQHRGQHGVKRAGHCNGRQQTTGIKEQGIHHRVRGAPTRLLIMMRDAQAEGPRGDILRQLTNVKNVPGVAISICKIKRFRNLWIVPTLL
jgi:hypothetical protein